MTPPTRYLINLPLAAPDPSTAVRVARVVARSLSFHNLIEYDQTTVTTEDDPGVIHPALCPRQLPNGRRCLLRPDHDGACTRHLPR